MLVWAAKGWGGGFKNRKHIFLPALASLLLPIFRSTKTEIAFDQLSSHFLQTKRVSCSPSPAPLCLYSFHLNIFPPQAIRRTTHLPRRVLRFIWHPSRGTKEQPTKSNHGCEKRPKRRYGVYPLRFASTQCQSYHRTGSRCV